MNRSREDSADSGRSRSRSANDRKRNYGNPEYQKNDSNPKEFVSNPRENRHLD